MQNLNFFRNFCIALVMLLAGLMMQSCGCENVTCVNGECKDGSCECPAGYTGDLCQFADCSETECPVNAECEVDPATGEGICYCLLGFEGDTCQTRTRDLLVGLYDGTGDACIDQNGTPVQPFPFPPYEASVASITGDTRFVIQNFGDFPAPQITLNCMVLGVSSWDIDDTTFAAGSTTKSIVGSSTGRIIDSLSTLWLNIDYRVTFSDNTYQDCDMEMKKK